MRQLEVMVVDDQVDVAESTGQLLRIYGYHVSVFNSGQSVLDALDGVTPDLILSDIGMPQMDGIELATRVKQHAGCENVILAAISGFEDAKHRQAAVDAGFDYRFVKPMCPEVLQIFMLEIAKKRRR